MGEQLNLLEIARHIEEFTNQLPKNGVSNYVLEGPILHEGTRTIVAAGLFPPILSDGNSTCAILTTSDAERGKMAEYHSRILHNTLLETSGVSPKDAVSSRILSCESTMEA